MTLEQLDKKLEPILSEQSFLLREKVDMIRNSTYTRKRASEIDELLKKLDKQEVDILNFYWSNENKSNR